MADVPQLSFPVRFDPQTGRLAVVEQGSLQNLAERVRLLLLTQPGDRLYRIDYGRPGLVFAKRHMTRPQLIAALREFEPEIDALIEESPDLFDEALQELQVNVFGEE